MRGPKLGLEKLGWRSAKIQPPIFRGRGTGRCGLLAHLHLLVDAVVQKEVVGHADTVGLHRMTLSVVEVAHVGVVKVRDLRLPAHGAMLRLMLCLPRRNEEDGPR